MPTSRDLHERIFMISCVPGSINSHYFLIIGDGKHQPNSRGLYTHEIRIPSLKVGGLPSPTKRDNLDHGTCSIDRILEGPGLGVVIPLVIP